MSIKEILLNLKKFKEVDLRLKLRFLEKIFKIKLYPNFFYKTGIKSYWSKIIFYFLYKEFSKKDYNLKYEQIFKSNLNLNSVNLISTFPRSGTTFCKILINSYNEIKNNTGDGLGKYLLTNDTFVFNVNTSPSLNMFDEVYKNYDIKYY